MNQPLVTVVTPSYNQGHFIRATIESVLSQDYPNLEYLIMDGGSTDETPAVAAEYSSRLRFTSELDRGQSHAINKGFQQARGEIVSWLNSDDTILPGAVGHAVRAFERRPALGAVYGEGYLIDYAGAITSRFPATEKFNLWKLVYASDFILQQTVYFRRAIFDEIGFLDENLNWGMDWDILVRIGKLYAIEYIPEYMGCLREYGEAKSFSGGGRRFRELAAIMRRHGTKRYPPGYVTYGLDTYQKLLCDGVEKLTPGFLDGPSRFARRAITYGAHRVIARVLRESQGLYVDGWAGPVARYMVPAGNGNLRIRGILPKIGNGFKAQELSIWVNRKPLHRRTLEYGPFEVETEPGEHQGPAEFEVRASKYIVPARLGLGPDSRRLSYQLTHVERTERCRLA